MRYALIENNQVKDIFVEPEGVSIEECFTPEIVSLYTLCSDTNIIEGDFYNSETQEFSENPNKKFPNHSIWFKSLRKKEKELSEYISNLLPNINNLPMFIQRLGEYKTALQFVLTGVDEVIEIDDQQFTENEFKAILKYVGGYYTTIPSKKGDITIFKSFKDISKDEMVNVLKRIENWAKVNKGYSLDITRETKEMIDFFK